MYLSVTQAIRDHFRLSVKLKDSRAAINSSEFPDISVTTESLGNNSSVKHKRYYTRAASVTAFVTTCLDKDKNDVLSAFPFNATQIKR